MTNGYSEFGLVRCPLCFRALNEYQYLIRFCPGDRRRHDTTLWERFNCSTNNLNQLIHCPNEECRSVTQLRAAVHFLHVGCSAVNPFWSQELRDGEGGVEVAEDFVDLSRSVTKDGEIKMETRRVRVTHWQVALLRQAAAIPELAERPEMWFPQLLLRAMYERNNQGTSIAQRVKLGGSKGAGKSIAATMMLAARNVNSQDATFLGNYVHVASTLVAQRDAFLRAIYPFQVLDNARSSETDWAPPTASGAGPNVKAFFSQRPLRADRKRLCWFRQILQNAGILRVTEAPAELAGILFYDTAGEDGQGDHNPFFAQLDQSADIVAAVVSPIDFVAQQDFKLPPVEIELSAATAVRVMDGAAKTGVAKCIIVTKLDLVKLSDVQQRERLDQALEIVKKDPTSAPGMERDILLDLLSAPGQNSNAAGHGGPQAVQSKLAQMVANYEKVHRVFFIWTEGADQPQQFPVTYGAPKFWAWCREGAPPETRAQPEAGSVRA